MSKLRSISTGFWSDPFIEDLTPDQKLLFIYLITNEKTNMLGIYEASDKKISFETGISKVMVSKAFELFESVNKIKRIGHYVILVNYMKHQNYNTNMKKSAIDTYHSLPKDLKDNDLDIDRSNPLEGFERLLNHYGMVRKIEVEEEREKEVEEEIEGLQQKFSFKKAFLDLGVEEKYLNDWLKVRKDKKASNTETAFKKIEKEIKASRLNSFNDAIRICAEQSWKGFKDEWLDNLDEFKNGKITNTASSQPSIQFEESL